MYTFEVQLSDVDRGVYETLPVRMACHPSETREFLLTRLLAYCLEYTEGIAFSRGISDSDEPAIAVRDRTGALQTWIDVGSPEASRLHRASKAAPRVAVYTHKDPALFLRQYAGEKIHRAESLALYAVDRALLSALASRLERRMTLGLSVTKGYLYVTLGKETLTGTVERLSLGG